MMVRQGLWLAIGGTVIGLAGAFWLSRVAQNLLFGITGADIVTFTVVPVALLSVAAIATLLPALRASRIDPTVALRE
jgi:ABC-type antimicrobial peptide transport system permease subunit